jgi:hypothetical protein
LELLYALELVAPDAFDIGFDHKHPQVMDAIVIARTELPSNEKSGDISSAVAEWVVAGTSSTHEHQPVRVVADQLVAHAGYEIAGDILRSSSPRAKRLVRRARAIVDALIEAARASHAEPLDTPTNRASLPVQSDHFQKLLGVSAGLFQGFERSLAHTKADVENIVKEVVVDKTNSALEERSSPYPSGRGYVVSSDTEHHGCHSNLDLHGCHSSVGGASRLSKEQAAALKIVLNNAWFSRSCAIGIVDSVNDYLENEPEAVLRELQSDDLASAAGALNRKGP